MFPTYGLFNLTEEQTSNCTYLTLKQHQTCLSFCFSQSWRGLGDFIIIIITIIN